MNRAAEERPDDEGRKTVLIVEDDPGTQRVLASGFATSLGMFDVLTANHGKEAVELLESRHVDVVVTDLAMPVMDGFALIGYLTNRGTTLPVVVLSALAPTTVAEGLDGYGGLTVLRKPAGYPEVARAVLDALERHDLGQVAGIPLASVLQLVEAERRTCSLGVTSGRRHGHLHFESGRLVNAFSDDFGAEGEAAAYDILTWSRTAIEFGRLPEGVRRTIDMPTQTLLIEVARRQDEQREREAKLTPPTPLPRTSNDALDAPEPVAAPPAAPDERSHADASEDATEDGTEDTTDDAASVATEDWADREPDRAFEPELGADLDMEPVFVAEPEAEPEPEAETEVGAGPDLEDTNASEPAPDPITTHAEANAPHATAELAHDVEPARTPHLDAAPEAVPSQPPPAPGVQAPGPAAPVPSAAPHAELVAAIERLTLRVHAADSALVAVADEVDAFRAAQQRYDDDVRRDEERRLAVEAARRDVADLARQILVRMDGLFEVFDDGASDGPTDARPPAPTSNG